MRLTPETMTRITKCARIVGEKGTTLDLFRVLGDDSGTRRGSNETERTRFPMLQALVSR